MDRRDVLVQGGPDVGCVVVDGMSIDGAVLKWIMCACQLVFIDLEINLDGFQ